MKGFQDLGLKTRSNIPKVLVVDDDDITATMVQHQLSSFAHVDIVHSGIDALEHCRLNAVDLIVLDLEMPDMNGLQVCAKLKVQDTTKEIPIVFLTSHHEQNLHDLCWEAGCVDFVTKPIEMKSLSYRVKAHSKLKLATDEIKNIALLDGLTQVFNRRYLDTFVEQQMKLHRRRKDPLSLLMIDIDLFKNFNDSLGHLAGDDCLKDVAAVLSGVLIRPTDVVARYGGEEFTLVLPHTSEKGARHVANAIHDELARRNLTHPDAPSGRVTVSIGAVTATEVYQDRDEVFKKADDALYQAKEQGRNQTVFVTL